jgi:putative transposase
VTTRAPVRLARTADAACFPSQPLLVEVLRRPVESTTYASEDYQRVLAERGLVCSMSRRGNPYDNAVMEAWNSTFKIECGERFLNNDIARAETFDYIEVFYNQKRLHSAIGYVSPAEFEKQDRERLAA